jgi:PBP1b-binding outer membrane lipoprotein LpoB
MKMKKISLLIAIIAMFVLLGCSSRAVELEKSPCACNNKTQSIRV